MRKFFWTISTVAMLSTSALPAASQDGATLADIRQEAAVLSVELLKLKRELSTTGAPGTGFSGASTLERVDLMEAALSRLTARTEELEYRIDRVVKDGTNQLDDLNFRLCELETGCDIGNLPPLEPIGGVAVEPAAIASGPGTDAPMEGLGELAIAEQADYDAAQALFDQGSYAEAAEAFLRFSQTYTGGPLTSDADYMRGESLTQAGDTAEAARAYLAAFSANPEGDRAPASLFKLGGALVALGQADRGCVMLTEVTNRFPGSDEDAMAQSSRQDLGCP